MASKSKLEDLNLTRDELKRLEDALKDEKFRQMFCEYAQELSDPENRRRYEEEIAQMERERGMDVSFVRPEPGYVLKTCVDGDKKAFINISKSDKIDKPSSERKQNDEGKSGLMWHIPHSFAPPREDRDKHKSVCQVYDFVVHPDTFRMAESNARFKKLVEDTAMDGIERQFQVKLDRVNIKRPKMQFKGVPSATVIRNRNAKGPQPEQDNSGLLKDMPYPYDDKTTLEKMKERDQQPSKDNKNLKEKTGKNSQASKAQKDDAAVPKYTIIHRSELDMQEYRNAPDSKPSTRPRELVIKIELPLLKSAAQLNLDIFEKRLTLESSPPAAYKLDLSLPYPVDDNKGTAKFDKQKRTLVVTLPVVPGDLPSVPTFINEDGTKNESESNGVPSSNHNGDISAEKPLIEVLSNGLDSSLEDTEKMQQKKAVGKENGVGSTDNMSGRQSSKIAVSYSLPEFSFTQDTETVSFVLKVKNVAENSIKRVSPSNHEVDFICTSQGEGGFPLHFRLCLRFAEGSKIVPEHCTVDVTAENVVLLLLKEKGSRGLWDEFWAGLHSDNLEKHLFLTTSNLQQQLKELDQSSAELNGQGVAQPAAGGGEEGPDCSLEVTAMDEKKLTIKISPSGKNMNKKAYQEEEDDEYDPPSSAEVQVVDSRPSPNQQGIPKHSVSGSSEAVSHHDDGPHSPNEDEDLLSLFSIFQSIKNANMKSHQDEEEEDEYEPLTSPEIQVVHSHPSPSLQSILKRSVSESSAEVSHDADSPHSSHEDEDLSPTASFSVKRSVSFSEHIDKATFQSSASVNSMKTALKSKRKRQRKLEERRDKNSSRKRHNSAESECSSDDHLQSAAGAQSLSGEGERAIEEKNADHQSHASAAEQNVLDFRTKPAASEPSGSEDLNPSAKTKNKEVEKSSDSVGLREKDDAEVSCRDDGSKAEGSTTSVHPKDSATDGSRGGGNSTSSKTGSSIADTVRSKMAESTTTSVCDDSDDEEEGTGGERGGSQDIPGAGPASDCGVQTHNEHRTECAFQFSNAVMFDLDVE